MPRGSGPKREREYEELKHKFKKNHRYRGREEEVAARIVNKQRRQYGETKGEHAKDKRGESPDRNLPIDNYQHMTVPQVKSHLKGCSEKQVEKIRKYEENHKHRKTLLAALDQQRGD